MKNYELTPREDEIMNLVAKGYSNKQICKKLFIEDCTVNSHLANVYRKIGVTNGIRTTAMTRARAILIYLNLADVKDWEE